MTHPKNTDIVKIIVKINFILSDDCTQSNVNKVCVS